MLELQSDFQRRKKKPDALTGFCERSQSVSLSALSLRLPGEEDDFLGRQKLLALGVGEDEAYQLQPETLRHGQRLLKRVAVRRL